MGILNNVEIKQLRHKTIELGKIVAAQHTKTIFPEWCLLKIGSDVIKGIPFDFDYYQSLIEPVVTSVQEN